MQSNPVLFINVTRQCNVHCDRCYLTLENRQNPSALCEQDLLSVLDSSWADNPNLTLIWEGGEASLVGKQHLSNLIASARSRRPGAKHTMVSNLYSFPNWLIEMTHNEFSGMIETTFAMNGKYSLDGNRERFLEMFKKHYKKVTQAGITCPVNLELNDHTIALGAPALIDYLADLGPVRVEFDISVDFKQFLAEPGYTLHGYPILPSTASYAQFSGFVKQFWEELLRRGLEKTITSSLIDEMRFGTVTTMFGVQRASDFLTINPDGTLTTNPLFSDLVPTYLGNVRQASVEQMLNGKKRQHLIRHELRKTANCLDCAYYSLCEGGPSHAPTFDASDECAGMRSLRTYFRNT